MTCPKKQSRVRFNRFGGLLVRLLLQYLMKKGGHINVQDSIGRTPYVAFVFVSYLFN